jgi:site-specific DNA recombinase
VILAYVRISNDERGRSKSPDRQRDLITQHVLNAGMQGELVWFEDEGVSAFSERRPGWQAILKLLRSGKADTLIATDLSRLHRRVRDALVFYEDYLVKRNVRLILTHERIDTLSAEGKLEFTNRATFNEYFRIVTSQKTKTALSRKRARLEKLGGLTPYGWDAQGSLLIPNDREQAVIKLMQHLAAEGKSLTEISSHLRRLGIPTKQGQLRWDTTTITRVLRRANETK